ncbi:matrix remodeling-associated protein 8-like isoform X2 [Megalobrama amblycephala]|uniref:matrix remodeling-associated protein 8-like isoform X2 n=1 Tax=Megalobrama amblycephala TaxID=75352 RepID=UPI0020140B25|nr:matrix remodeling-associated protein 8-like isoform X2 [Megalobrama amblycephala]
MSVMIIRCCIVLVPLFMLMNEESQFAVEGITVNWKHHDTLKVYDIIKGQGSVEGQDPAFKSRAETFPDEYEKGNFSLKLNNLEYNDTGKYQCYIIEESDIQTVELLIEVPLQVPIEDVIGGSAVLPCSARERIFTTEDITVKWRHNKTLNVFDIIKGEVSVEKQDSSYKNRTATFPEEYLNGNFSLKLNNLQHNDTGIYKCYITNELIIQSVKLEINQGAQSKPEKILLLVPFLCFYSAL